MDFEQRDSVSIEEYLKMIQWKTAVLFAAALKIGALLGGANPLQAQGLYEYGLGVGLAFQIQDDILEIYSNVKSMGKTSYSRGWKFSISPFPSSLSHFPTLHFSVSGSHFPLTAPKTRGFTLIE